VLRRISKTGGSKEDEMEDGYPEKKELEQIKHWKITQENLHSDLQGLLEFIEDLWKYADIDYFKIDGRKFELHTGGWSGNEMIMEALEGNWLFWMMYWQKSKRGGHYYFELPKSFAKEK